jgi:hypothetical protein
MAFAVCCMNLPQFANRYHPHIVVLICSFLASLPRTWELDLRQWCSLALFLSVCGDALLKKPSGIGRVCRVELFKGRCQVMFIVGSGDTIEKWPLKFVACTILRARFDKSFHPLYILSHDCKFEGTQKRTGVEKGCGNNAGRVQPFPIPSSLRSQEKIYDELKLLSNRARIIVQPTSLSGHFSMVSPLPTIKITWHLPLNNSTRHARPIPEGFFIPIEARVSKLSRGYTYVDL